MAQPYHLNQDPEGLVFRYLDDPKPDLKDLILVQYASLVEKIARRFSGLEPFEDLVQVGYIGLLNALTKFDRDAGVRFNTYATYLIAGEIKHYLRDRAQTIRQPAWLQELRHKVKRAVGQLQQELGRQPTEREVASALNVSEQSIREVFATQDLLRLASIDQGASGDDDPENELDRFDPSENDTVQLGVEDRVLLENAMKQLRDLERHVLVHFHFDSMTQTEIAAKLNISCNYVSHILRQSLSKLRRILSAEEEKDRQLRRETSDVNYDIMDAETGAYTEAFFKARIEEEVHRASCESGHVGLVLVCMRGTESLRAFYGEQSVRDFLADTAEFLKSSVRRLDLVCRTGNSSFGVILPSTGANAVVVQKRLVDRIEKWIATRFSQSSQIQVSFGHASYPDDAASVRDLLDKAAPKFDDDLEQAA